MQDLEIIKSSEGELLCVIIRANFIAKESHFITDENAVQNVGYFLYKKGNVVKPHFHPPVERTIYGTPEVVLVKSGRIKLVIFDNAQKLVGEYLIQENDTFLLISGGHAEEFLEKTTVFVVKQGPYLKEKDKIHF